MLVVVIASAQPLEATPAACDPAVLLPPLHAAAVCRSRCSCASRAEGPLLPRIAWASTTAVQPQEVTLSFARALSLCLWRAPLGRWERMRRRPKYSCVCGVFVCGWEMMARCSCARGGEEGKRDEWAMREAVRVPCDRQNRLATKPHHHTQHDHHNHTNARFSPTSSPGLKSGPTLRARKPPETLGSLSPSTSASPLLPARARSIRT